MTPMLTSFAAAVLVALLSILNGATEGHQAFSYPIPMSRLNSCSRTLNCPNTPCPRRKLRRDVNPNAPSLRVRRGQFFSIRIRRNNHRWGFGRYSLVNVKDRYSAAAHSANAFYYVCGDMHEKRCKGWQSKMLCPFDKRNLYFNHRIMAPTHAPDGVYVLAWVWYGSRLIDFHDCTYIEIRGGMQTSWFRPRFVATASATGSSGRCKSTTNDLSLCGEGKCRFGGIYGRAKLQVPKPFEGGKQPALLGRWNLRPYRLPPPRGSNVRIGSIAIVDAKAPRDMKHIRTWQNKAVVHICLKKFRPAVVCSIGGGPLEHVMFMRTGMQIGKLQFSPPFAYGGTQRNGELKPLNFDYNDTFFSVGCYAMGKDGSEDWKTLLVTTQFEDGSC